MSYLVRITWHDGSVSTATVTRAALKALNLKSCASVKWVRQ
jgi:hypothetical protein